MPNPVMPIKRGQLRRLKPRQKALVRKLRRAGLPVRVYRRKGNANRISVHNPFLDVVRKAKKGTRKTTARIPQARDTAMQRKAKKKRRLMLSKSKAKFSKGRRGRGLLLP